MKTKPKYYLREIRSSAGKVGVSFKTILYHFRFLIIFPLLDIISTFWFMRKYRDYNMEANFIGRFLLKNLEGFAYPIMFIYSVVMGILLLYCCFLFWGYIWKFTKKEKKYLTKENFIWFQVGVFFNVYSLLYILVILNNFEVVNLWNLFN